MPEPLQHPSDAPGRPEGGPPEGSVPSPSPLAASVIGATGLVGRHLVPTLLADPRFDPVRVFQRRSTGVQVGDRRTEEHEVDFERIERWGNRLGGDILFSSLGTTRRAAGSREAQYRVDHDYQVEAARHAAAAGTRILVLVSSVGANPDARNFYLRMKGQVEEAVKALPFEAVHLLRPGLLDGDRDELRAGELLGLVVARGLARLGAPARLRPIHAEVVARAMVRVATSPVERRVSCHEAADLFALGGADRVPSTRESPTPDGGR
jgi:uncharacterized protein YbjT (DUF2867 family)